MARTEVFLFLIAALTVPLADGAGCPAKFALYGDICLSVISDTAETWADANATCIGMEATLAVIKDYPTQANLVMLLKNVDDDVYIGYRRDSEDSAFQWPSSKKEPGLIGISQFLEDFTRWGIGQPDGPLMVTDQDYCAVLETSNTKQLGLWYDVPCDEEHKYICSREVDSTKDTTKMQVIQNCPEGWYGYNDDTCFKLIYERNEWATYDQAKERCLNGSDGIYSLATIRDGFESALIQVLMNERGVPYAWIGFSSKDSKGEFQWESGYPVEYTNWATNEPSARESEGCARAFGDGNGWDDTTCLDASPYVCRFDKNPPQFPTVDPAIAGFKCPDVSWKTFDGSDSCYFFDSREEDWGVANIRCMQNINSQLVSINSAAENEFIYNEAVKRASNQKLNRFVWIGLTRTVSSRGDWGQFRWIDNTELNYAAWAREEPNGDEITGSEVPETCVLMSLDEGGTWGDRICQSEELPFVCELKKQPGYVDEEYDCTGVKMGDSCYTPSNLIDGLTSEAMTWLDAENICRKQAGHLVSIYTEEEQILVRELSVSYARSYWIGLRKENGKDDYIWSDDTPFDSKTLSKFPSLPPENLAGEEDCAEILIWQNGIWGTSACGNSLPFICKRKDVKGPPPPQLTAYPPTGSCPDKYFQLGNMCYLFKSKDGGKTWLEARDDCRNEFNGTLATISNPGQQAFLTSLIKDLNGLNLWIGLNSIGIHSQYHWTDGTALSYLNWREGTPSNIVPITEPNSATCVTMMSAEDYAGEWNDGLCNDKRPYLCQAPLGDYTATPPTYPGSTCPDDQYRPYYQSCFLMESIQTKSFEEARKSCVEMKGDLMSPIDRFELSLLTASLYRDNMKDGDEAWIGLQRHSITKAFWWIDGWPLNFTRWGPNEPSNVGDCVAVTREGTWAARNCENKKFYFCEYPMATPPKPEPPVVGDCAAGFVEVVGTNKCVLFKPSVLPVRKNQVTYTCQVDHAGGEMPSIHTKGQDDFIRKGAAAAFGADAQIWLGINRNEKGENKWTDGSEMDYTNWMAGEPNPVGSGNTKCVVMNLDGGWADVDCDKEANFICMGPKFPRPNNSATSLSQVTAWAILLLVGAAAMATRC